MQNACNKKSFTVHTSNYFLQRRGNPVGGHQGGSFVPNDPIVSDYCPTARRMPQEIDTKNKKSDISNKWYVVSISSLIILNLDCKMKFSLLY